MGVMNLRTIPNDLHRALKIEAAQRGMTLRDLVVEVLADYMQRQTGAGSKKKT